MAGPGILGGGGGSGSPKRQVRIGSVRLNPLNPPPSKVFMKTLIDGLDTSSLHADSCIYTACIDEIEFLQRSQLPRLYIKKRNNPPPVKARSILFKIE